MHIYMSCIYFAHWEFFPCLYYPASLLQVCHFSCSCIFSSASLTSQEVLHQYQTTAWLEYLCDSIICHAEQQQQGNQQYYKLEQSKNALSKNGKNKKEYCTAMHPQQGAGYPSPNLQRAVCASARFCIKIMGVHLLVRAQTQLSQSLPQLWRVLLDLVGCR